MAEYFEREALLREIERRERLMVGDKTISVDALKRFILNRPTADVAPVVHGRWEWFDEETGTPSTGYEREWGWRCSHCREELPDDYDDPDDSPAFRFCYNCGAKMDGGDSDVRIAD